ncbi:HAE1 family hydrophobic/amphiphilic exporter-1 [Sporomusaceae bacterium BoRhaA]|uniref:efflux RND transporter permease subunit n=1 Tax=Pelorhabdus rhamnosifermentans TaxID=2772457 RepID=UPI001C06067A|nr:efflux RND transporter permease subunit [Pelorhabdus rhamnosifermentans]MBU2703033.1 HAE1 family hydrophobic/amphiphilic exporter-1 [Pelorhabdus rhamnosifermentans]
MSFLRVFIKRPVFTTMLVFVLVVFGLSALPRLGIDLLPDVDFPIVAVVVTWDGASPEEMENLVAKPIENAVSAVSGIKTIKSTSRPGLAQVVIEFVLGTDPRMAAADVREKVGGIRKALPDQIDEPTTQRYDMTASPIVYYSLYSDQRPRGEIRKMANDIVKDRLQQLDGVGNVAILGGSDREIQVRIDPRRLDAYGLTLDQVISVVNSANANTPGGYVKEKGYEMVVRTLGQFHNVDEIGGIAVTNINNQVVFLRDVASVEDSFAEERTYAETSGSPSVVVSVQKQSGTNTVAVADAVKSEMDKIEQELPGDVHMAVVRDGSLYIKSNVEDVEMSLVLGGLLAVLIVFLFLRDTRATLIGALAIPTSVIATFSLMKVGGFTLNNMSLMGLSLAVGILIDDAIVVVENIHRHIEEGATPAEGAVAGTAEISLAVLATTLSILAVFIPVGSMGEIIGMFFRQFGLTVAFAVAFSLFVAFTLTPMLSARWLRAAGEAAPKRPAFIEAISRQVERLLNKWESGFEALRDFYRKFLQWSLRRPVLIVSVAVVSLLVNFFFVPFLGFEFQPTYDSGEFNINITAPPGTSIEQMRELSRPIEQEVLAMPETRVAFLNVGYSHNPVNKALVGVKLTDASDRQRTMMDIMDQLRMKFRNYTGLKISIMSASSMGGGGDNRPVQVGFQGDDMHILLNLSQELAERLRHVEGATDVDTSANDFEPEVQVILDRAKAGQAGVNADTVGYVVQTAFAGNTTANRYRVGDKDYDIRIRLHDNLRLKPDDVANIRVTTKTGSQVRLGDIAHVNFTSGPTEIDREDRQREVIVYANNIGVSAGDIINATKNEISQMNIPFGYHYKFVGQTRTMNDSFKEIGHALILAVILIYMVLAAQFESFIHPLTIMLSLPFALIGAILGLLVSAKTINIMSLIGIIMLMGLVAKNAILLVDYTNTLRERDGLSREEALLEAGTVRLRPILMTTAAMILGMIPIALGWGAGAELRSSMGVVVVGGLITSTILTLVVVPQMYIFMDKLQTWWKNHGSHNQSSGKTM